MNYHEFIELVRSGDLDRVKAAVKAHPDLPHTCDPSDDWWEERTAMHSAARHAHLGIVKFLVSCRRRSLLASDVHLPAHLHGG